MEVAARKLISNDPNFRSITILKLYLFGVIGDIVRRANLASVVPVTLLHRTNRRRSVTRLTGWASIMLLTYNSFWP